MKQRISAGVAFAVTACMVAHALAGQPTTRPATTRPASAGDAQKKSHDRLIADLKLDAPRKALLRDIFRTYRRDMAEWKRKHGPEMERLRRQLGKYHRPRDAQTKRASRASMAKLMTLQKQARTKQAKFLAKLKGVLTPDQFTRARMMLMPRPRTASGMSNKFHMLTELGLTRKQWGRIKAILAEEAKKAKAAGKAKVDPRQAAWPRIVKEVLTEKDRQKLSDRTRMLRHRRMVLSTFGSLDLTTEQSARVDAIWKKAYDSASKRSDDRFAIYARARQEIARDVLTADQRKRLEQ